MTTTNPFPSSSQAERGSQRSPAPRVAPADMHEGAPALGWYTDNILFGEAWERSALSKRDRSIVTVAALITAYQTAQLVGHFGRALKHGVRPTEIAEIVTHLAFYAGWPCAASAVNVMRQVFSTAGIGFDQIAQSVSHGMPVPKPDAAQPAGTFAPALSEFWQRVVVDDLWQRSELAPRDRSLVTIVSLICQGQIAQLGVDVEKGLAHGLTETDLSETVTHLAFYLGWPRVVRALPALEEAVRNWKGRP